MQRKINDFEQGLNSIYEMPQFMIYFKCDRTIISSTLAVVIGVTAASLFERLLQRSLRTQDYGQLDDMYCSIVEKLKHEDRVIVVDEAQHLSLGNIELLRDIYDDSETAIVLVGNEKLYNKIAADKGKDYAQLFSRIGIKEHVLTDDTTRKDVKNICVGVDDDGIDFLYSIARNAGGLRSAVIIYHNGTIHIVQLPIVLCPQAPCQQL